MDGIEAADRIRHLDVPVVYLTAFSDDATLRRARETEPFGYVLKPFDDRELQIVIELGIIATGRRRSTTSCCGNRPRAPPSRRSIAGPGSWRTPASSFRSPWTSSHAGHHCPSRDPGSGRLGRPARPRTARLQAGQPPPRTWKRGSGPRTAAPLPTPLDLPLAYPNVMRTGDPELIAEFSEEVLASIASDAENLRFSGS